MSKRNCARSKRGNKKIIGGFFGIFCLVSFLFFPILVEGEMTSTHYTIYADSIDSGGVLSTGGSVFNQDTLGESMAGINTGGQYVVRGGFQYLERGYLSVSVSDTDLPMGNLSSAAIISADTTITVNTDSATGYTLSFGNIIGNSIAPVNDGAVTAGSEEYGVSVSGVHSLVSGDVSVASNLALASSASAVNGVTTTVVFKASISASSNSGSFGQTIPIIVAANIF